MNDQLIDPFQVRFSQQSIKAFFRDGGSVDELVSGLKDGTIRPEDVTPIRLVMKDGYLFTFDNRRLEAFRRAKMNIPFRMATAQEIGNESGKFTTTNGGTSIRIR